MLKETPWNWAGLNPFHSRKLSFLVTSILPAVLLGTNVLTSSQIYIRNPLFHAVSLDFMLCFVI